MGRLRILSAGESHGPKLAVIIEGLPAGLKVDTALVDRDLERRQQGYGRGYRMRSIEKDRAVFSAGLRFGETFGAPLLIEVENVDHAKWKGVMEPLPVDDPEAAEAKSLKRPRPGHADLAGGLKYARRDLRDILERASARSTAVRVAAGAIAKQLLKEVGAEIFSIVTCIGGAEYAPPDDLRSVRDAAEASDVRCPDPATADAMRRRIDEAQKAGDTVGGAFIIAATGLPVGLGSYAEWDRRLDGRLAQAVMSIQAVKAVEIGIGTRNAHVFGSQAHDEIVWEQTGPGAGRFVRPTNRAGGLEGGMTNGADLIVRGTMKPISTLAKPLASVNIETKTPALAGYERSDVCAVPACAVIAEAAVALCLADAIVEAYGGDTMEELRAHHQLAMARMARA